MIRRLPSATGGWRGFCPGTKQPPFTNNHSTTLKHFTSPENRKSRDQSKMWPKAQGDSYSELRSGSASVKGSPLLTTSHRRFLFSKSLTEYPPSRQDHRITRKVRNQTGPTMCLSHKRRVITAIITMPVAVEILTEMPWIWKTDPVDLRPMRL